MKLSQKRTCSGCRLESTIPGKKVLCCGIGFNTKTVYKYGIQIGIIPLEPCPKPMNYKDKSELPFMPNKREVLEYFKTREHETNAL